MKIDDHECESNNPLEVINVQPGKRYRLRILSIGMRVALSFGIQNHTLTVVNMQGEDVKPIDVKTLEIPIAYRYDVILHADQPVDNYWIYSQIVDCTLCNHTNITPNVGLTGLAILRYSGAPDAEPSVPFDATSEQKGIMKWTIIKQ